jgi:hypothetical protein
MTALFRYTLATVLHSQRYVAPAVFFITIVAILTDSDSGPLIQTYAASAAATLACSAWLAVAVIGTEEPVGRSVLVVAARRPRDVLLASVAATFAFCLVLGVAGLVYPVYSGDHTVTRQAVGFGAVAEFTCAVVGIGLGLLCSRLVVPRPGFSVLLGLTLVLGTLVLPWLPVYPMLRSMSADHLGSRLPVFALCSALGVALLVAATAVTQYAGSRRD